MTGNVMVGLSAQHESIPVDVAASFDCPANEQSAVPPLIVSRFIRSAQPLLSEKG